MAEYTHITQNVTFSSYPNVWKYCSLGPKITVLAPSRPPVEGSHQVQHQCYSSVAYILPITRHTLYYTSTASPTSSTASVHTSVMSSVHFVSISVFSVFATSIFTVSGVHFTVPESVLSCTQLYITTSTCVHPYISLILLYTAVVYSCVSSVHTYTLVYTTCSQ